MCLFFSALSMKDSEDDFESKRIIQNTEDKKDVWTCKVIFLTGFNNTYDAKMMLVLQSFMTIQGSGTDYISLWSNARVECRQFFSFYIYLIKMFVWKLYVILFK